MTPVASKSSSRIVDRNDGMNLVRQNLWFRATPLLGIGVLVVTLAIAFVVMYTDLARNDRVLSEQLDAIAELDRCAAAAETFSEMRYWLTEYSLGWQNHARDCSNDCLAKLESQIRSLNSLPHIEQEELATASLAYYDKMAAATVAYISEARLRGNLLASEARAEAEVIHDALSSHLAEARDRGLSASAVISQSNGRLQTIVFAVAALVLLGSLVAAIISEQARRLGGRNQELARLVSESPNEMYIVDLESLRIVEVNDKAVASTQYSREELQVMRPFDLDPKMNNDRVHEISQRLISGESSDIDFRSTIYRKDGSSYPVHYSLYVSHFHGKAVLAAYASDVSDVTALEERVSRANKLESVGQLAAGIAHEINTPMQFVNDNIEYLSDCSAKLFDVVDSFQNLLARNCTPLPWSERLERMEKIAEEHRFDRLRRQMPAAIEESLEGVQRTVTILRAMKEFSHPGGEDKKPENLNHLIESTIAISRNRWKYSAELQTDLDPNLPDALMQSSEINQVLLNLIVNASDAIAEKNQNSSGTMGTISVRTYSDDVHVIVEVSDDGCGIPDHIRQKVFDPFFTTKDVGKGTGQGLAITHNVVVNMHSGEVDIVSEPGEGTTFIVKLPVAGTAAPLDLEASDEPHQLASL